MRLIDLDGRAALLIDGLAVDVAAASDGRFGPDPQALFDNWDRFAAWAQQASGPGVNFQPERLGAPAPRPRQVFAIGLNYSEHAAESGFVKPEHPVVFTKFASSISGPVSEVVLPPGGNTDWEVELVVVIGRNATNVAAVDAWSYVAGVTVGQDISERSSQHRGPAPQFSLAKSYPGFSPVGPLLLSADELVDPDDLELGCSIDGEVVQKGRTSQMIFSVPELISRLSTTVTLLPGDLIFTGTPAGVGIGRTPPRFLNPGNILRSWVSGVGEIEQHFTAAGISD